MSDDFPTSTTTWDHDAHQQRLATRLPETKAVAGAPIGTDDSILRRSLPPYATAGANPDLRAWLAQSTPEGHDERPYVDPGPFSTDISEGTSSLVYKAHAYPTKVPHAAIMRFLLHYTQPGDLVLDGFCGTGMTGVAAQACGQPDDETRRTITAEVGSRIRWGYRRAVLMDLAPSAIRIAAGLNLPISAVAFESRSREILDAFDAKWGWMYETTAEDGRVRPLDYVVWSEVFSCPSCAAAVVFYEVAYDPRTGRVAKFFDCPTCGAELTKDRAERRLVPIRTLAGDTTFRIELRPVAIHYRVGRTKAVKSPDDVDFAVLRRIAGLTLPGPVPTEPLPIEAMYHGSRLGPKGFTKVHHLWGDRALVSLSELWGAATAEEDPLVRLSLEFWVEQAFWGLSWLNRFVPVHYSHVNQYLTGVYYVPSQHAEYNPRQNLEGSLPARGKRRGLIKLWEQNPARLGQVAMTTGSSTSIDLPNASVDYVFVDPPFGSNIYYADLAFLTEAWQRVHTNASEEAIVNRSHGLPRTLTEYGVLMHRCFAEFNRVLKPGRWMTVEFSNSNNAVWLSIQHALARAGFVVADTRVFDKEHLSFRQVTALTAAKRDLIISAYKPAEQLELIIGPAAGKPETAWAFVREHLRHLPPTAEREPSGAVRRVRERLPDRLYDRMEAFHLQRNLAIPVTFAEFLEGLDKQFRKRDGMVFLDEQVVAYDRERATISELQAAQLFITDEDSAIQWLRQLLNARGTPQPYSAIMPEFFREMQAGLPDWESPPDLRLLLQWAFVADDQGQWYVPDPKKQGDLDKLRRRELLTEFASYGAGRGPLTAFSLAAVRAGFSDAWERRDFDTIVAVGRRLPVDAFTQDERLLFYLDNAEQLVA